jgi:hypothetical protein
MREPGHPETQSDPKTWMSLKNSPENLSLLNLGCFLNHSNILQIKQLGRNLLGFNKGRAIFSGIQAGRYTKRQLLTPAHPE